MDSIIVWFNNLHIIAKCLVILFSLPVVFFIVGLMVFIQEPPGNSLWGTDKPKLWQSVAGTIAVGFYSSIVLAAIFGSTYLLYQVLGWVGLGQGWVLTAAFIVCLLGILYGIYYWFEYRYHK